MTWRFADQLPTSGGYEAAVDQRIDRATPRYPRRLAGAPDAPERLFVRGALPPENAPAVAIVGARAASGHGVAMARALAADLAAAGAVVISGGAVGIDAAAHRGALAARGRTVAVLACGLDHPYPARNRPLFGDILAGGGAVVSPYQPGVPPRRFHFVRRNRIIAGMADAVIVIDASLASGALYTANAAVSLGRALGAAPGTAGCEALIAQGAAVVTTADDVFAAIAGTPRRPTVELPAPESAAGRVLAALGPRAQREQELSDATGLDERAVARALIGLEMEGLAVLAPGRAYLRSVLAEELMAN